MGGPLTPPPPDGTPPATSTWPLVSFVAVWLVRAWFKLLVGLHVPVLGSYSSADARAGLPPELSALMPPATNTWPLVRRVAVWPSRALFILPVRLHVPV